MYLISLVHNFCYRCAFDKSLCSKHLVIETDIIECERLLNVLYYNYLKESGENKYKISEMQNRLKTLISFQESAMVKRRESVNIYRGYKLFIIYSIILICY